MAARTIRELLVSLGVKADTRSVARFDRGITNVKRGMTGLLTTAALVTGGLLAVTGAMVRAAVSTATYADETSKAAARVGVTAQVMQEFAFAAEQSGANMTDVETAFRRLAVNAVEASRGTGAALSTFKQLGVETVDMNGKVKSTVDLFTEAAQAMTGLETATERMEAANRLFGRGGAKLLPLINAGASGIRELRDQASLYGRVISDAATRDGERFVDALNEARGVMAGLRNTIGIALLPTLIELIERFRDFFLEKRVDIGRRLTDAVDSVSAGLLFLADVIERVDAIVQSRIGGWTTIFRLLGTAIVGAIGVKVLTSVTVALAGLVQIGMAAVPVFTALAAALGIGVGATALLVVAVIGQLIISLAILAAGVATTLLVFEDFLTFLQGGDSIFGRFLDNFIDAEKVSKSLGETWDSLTRLAGALASSIGRVGSMLLEWVLSFDFVQNAIVVLTHWLERLDTFLTASILKNLREFRDLLDAISAGLESFAGGGDLNFGGVGAAAGQFFTPLANVGGGGAGTTNNRNVKVGDTVVQISGVGISQKEAEAIYRGVIQESNRAAIAAVAGGER